MFQIKRCTEVECLACSPVRLPAEVFENVHFLPAPTLDASKKTLPEVFLGGWEGTY